MTNKDTNSLAKNIRKNILFAAYNAGASSAHIGGALSVSDIIAVLFGNIAKIDSKNPLDKNRDRIILSKGHACLALYAVLVEKGFITKEELKTFEKSGSFLLGHPVINKQKGIEFSTGSLGMGLSLGIGVAISGKKRKLNFKTYVILGDGECNEGSVWEGAMLASHLKLNNLVVIVDRNNFQQTGKSDDILNLGNLHEKWKSFGWHTKEVDGHNLLEIQTHLKLDEHSDKPKAIIAKTIKGKGLSFAENNNEWHHKVLTKKNYEIALAEIENEKN